ncbi:hypothetical protein H0H93_011929 [Arthromyces matolae]|nr:hypothetical protein H0H93_011929 [Arthromyces matolae]
MKLHFMQTSFILAQLFSITLACYDVDSPVSENVDVLHMLSRPDDPNAWLPPSDSLIPSLSAPDDDDGSPYPDNEGTFFDLVGISKRQLRKRPNMSGTNMAGTDVSASEDQPSDEEIDRGVDYYLDSLFHGKFD